MVTVIATFEPKDSQVGEFLDLMSLMVESSRTEPGCLRYDLYEGGDGRFYLLEDYRDDAAVEAHRETRHYREYRSAVVDMLVAPIAVVVLHPVGTG